MIGWGIISSRSLVYVPLTGISVGASTAAEPQQADFTFQVTDLDSDLLRVTRFDGSEGLSQLFEFHVELSSSDSSLTPV